MKRANRNRIGMSTLFFVLGCLCLFLGVSYAIFSLSLVGEKDLVVTSGTLSLVLDDTMGENLVFSNMYPTLEEVAMKAKGYTFTLENTGDIDSKYTIYLDDLPILDSETRLEDKYARYNIQNDQGLNKTKALSQLRPNPNRVLDSGVIAPGKKYTYTLHIWMDYNADNNAMNKVFKGKIRVEAEQDTEYLPATLVHHERTPDSFYDTAGYFWDYKTNIVKVVFQNVKKKPGGVVKEWDVSATKDGTVMAYLTGEEVAGYTLYLQANGPINAGSSSNYLFLKFERLVSIEGLENLDTSQVVDMSHMFDRCKELQTLDLSHFDTSKVKDFSCMFVSDRKLVSLNISSFDTSRATDMDQMFYQCSKLEELDLSSFDTALVTRMGGMFTECSNLSVLDVSNFNTSKVTDMSWMFHRCSLLQKLDVSSFNTSKVTNMSNMFSSCSLLEKLDLSHFDTSKVTNMSNMFTTDKKLVALDLSNFDTSKVTSMWYMFQLCEGLTKLDVSHFDTSNVTSMDSMFYGCRSLKSLDLSNFRTEKVTSMSYMFCECSGLTNLDLSNFQTSMVKNMSGMFASCNGLTRLDLSHFDTSEVTDIVSMFSGCSNLEELDFSGADFSKVEKSDSMFLNASCKKIYVRDTNAQNWFINLDSNFTTENVIVLP